MKKQLFAAFAALVLASACATTTPEPPVDTSIDLSGEESRILAVLQNQQDAWNSGDIPAFMDGYWKDEGLRFASRADITYGWQETLDRYLESYDSPAKMGELTFDIFEVDLLSPTEALVFGAWSLKREADTPHGLFTLHFRKFGNDWLIVSDHTSGAS